LALDLETLVIQIEANTRDVDSKLRLLQASVNDSMAGIENRTNRMKSTFESNFGSISRITRNFSAGFAILETIRFGENIVQNIDKIATQAHKLGVVIDDDVVFKMNQAKLSWETNWTRMQVAAAGPIERILAGINRLTGALATLDEQSSKPMFPNAKNTLGVKPGGDAAAQPDRFARYFQDQASAGIDTFYQNTSAAAKKSAEEQKVLAQKSASDRESVMRALDETDKFLNDEKVQRFMEGIRQQMAAEQNYSEATVRLNEALQKQKDQFLVDNVDKIQKEFEGYARIEEQQTRMWERFKSGSEDAFASAISGAESFGSALRSVLAELEQMTIRQYLLKPLFDAMEGGSSGSGGGILGFLGGILGIGGGSAAIPASVAITPGLFGGALAGGGSVSPGTSYLVGERGAEIFQPNVPGTIYPSGTAPGGGNTMSVNIDLRGSNGSQEIRQAVQAGMAVAVGQIKQQFPALMIDAQMRHQ